MVSLKQHNYIVDTLITRIEQLEKQLKDNDSDLYKNAFLKLSEEYKELNSKFEEKCIEIDLLKEKVVK